MRRKVSDCVGCGLPCHGRSCPHYEVTELICDNCKEYADVLYKVNGWEYCAECALKEFERIDIDDAD